MDFRYLIPIFIFSTLIIFHDDLSAQSRRLERADEAFKQRHYHDAIESYERVLSRSRGMEREELGEIAYKLGVCYSMVNNTTRAEMRFRRAIRSGYDAPDLLLRYADMLFMNEKYDDALEHYKKFAEKYPDHPRAEVGIKSIETVKELKENPTRYEVEVKRAFNSRRGADFAPAYADHRETSVIFTSARDGSLNSRDDPWTGENFTNLFISFQDRQGDWSNPALLDEGPVNTEFNEGTPSLNPGKNELYFTRCVTSEGRDLGCRIYRSRRDGANWGEPSDVELVADSAVTVGHPAISPDELELFFVSDMPGGVGGKDIWVARRNSVQEEFGRPVNLGSIINTHGNEMFPYVREDGVLFFASDGHPGMGGLDIFMSEREGNSWSEPANVGYPINSSSDDYAIVFKSNKNKGYFSSNRAGRRGDEIYSFFLAPLEFALRGTVRDDSTKTVLPDATVLIIGTDGTIEATETNENGEYYFDKTMIKPNTTYEILASKSKYFSERGSETTIGVERSREFVFDFYLNPIPETPIELPEILYEFARWELQPQFEDSLAGLVGTLNDNPNIIIELASHTDSRGSHEHNDTLSQRRAQSVVNFLIDNGIDSRRLVARGYGKRNPREITRTIVHEGFTFEEGVVLTEEYINNLPTEKHREVAHQLNRRTEFRVLGEDFDPRNNNTPQDMPFRIDMKKND